MGKKILEINIKYDVPEDQLLTILPEKAQQFAAVDGLEWKVWIVNPEKKVFGGIYLFKDDASLTAYMESDLFKSLDKHPAFSDMKAKHFDVLPEFSKITRGPI